MKAITGFVFIGFLFAIFSVVAEVRIEQLDITQPRSFGYQIGDKFERSILLRLRKPYQLKIEPLPLQGRMTEWLALEEPIVDVVNLSDSTQYDIQLTYQIININPDVTDIAVPHHNLIYSDGKEIFKALIPASRISVSVLSTHANKSLQPDRIPSKLPQRYLRIILVGTLLLFALTGLAYLHWGLPFSAIKHPFDQACRDLKKLQHRNWDDNNCREALQIIHQAFNETAGKTVFVEQLDEFFSEHKQFTSIQMPIEDYFHRSRTYFFESDQGDQFIKYSLSGLLTLVQDCRDIERGLL